MTTTTVGKDNYTYTEIRDWAKLPRGETFGKVHDVATDSQERLYAFQLKDPPVVIFDRDGKYLGSWGNGAFKYPHMIHIANDIVYLVDRDSSVCMMYTLDGKPIRILGRHGVHSDTGFDRERDAPDGHLARLGPVPRAAGPFNHPTAMVPDSAGDLYVSDGYLNARIHRFSPEGRLKFSWGEPGKTGRGQFYVPHSLLVHEGLVYVCDRDNRRIQVFTTEGEHISTWPMQSPSDISIDREGILYVSEREGVDGAARRVSILDLKGNMLAHFDTRGGWGTGHGSWVDSHGDIYVVYLDKSSKEQASGVDKYIRRR
jgi:hypothetical protein